MQCPLRSRRCRSPGSCPADSASAGQSLPGEPPPGTRQRCLVEVDEEALPDFLLPWNGRGRALLAPARKGGSWVLSALSRGGRGPQAVKDWSSRSRLLGWRHFRAGLGLSMLLGESHRRASHQVSLPDGTYTVWRTFGSGPTTWFPSNDAVRTKERTWGWKPKFFRRASRRSNCKFDAAAKSADTAETCASWIMASFSRRSLERSSLGESSSITEATIESAKEA